MFFKKKPVILAHSGRFHADDLFATAVLLEYLKGEAEVVRSVDPKVIEKADFVVDIGRIYNPSLNRFDHHQGGLETRPNGIGYAAVGLVWKHFGEKVAGSKRVADMIDEKLIQQIDVVDIGQGYPKAIIGDVFPYHLNAIATAFSNTWKEEGRNETEGFMFFLPFARAIIQREIVRAQAKVEAESAVNEAYEKAEDKRLVVVDKIYPIDALEDKKEVLFMVSPESRSKGWCVRTIRKEEHGYANRKDLPKPWGGLSDNELSKVSGVPDATFCHLGLFLAVAKSREGALRLAQLALEYKG
jgi:uncharacterized UPF0160 family protein